MIRRGFHPELDDLRTASQEGKEWIARLEKQERERTGIKSLRVGFNKVFGYYIEVTRANLSLVPDDYERKQTLANAERYVTRELKAMEAKILGAEERMIEMEYRLFVELRSRVAQEASRLQSLAARLCRAGRVRRLGRRRRPSQLRPSPGGRRQRHRNQGRAPHGRRSHAA